MLLWHANELYFKQSRIFVTKRQDRLPRYKNEAKLAYSKRSLFPEQDVATVGVTAF